MKKQFFTLLALVSFSIVVAQNIYSPLTKKYNLTLFAGISPSIFSSRGEILAVAPLLTPSVFFATNNAKFGTAWKQPALNLAGNFGYTATDQLELFIECAYHKAHAKNYSLRTANNSGIIHPKLTDFQSINSYTGFRWYTYRFFSNTTSTFIGLKAGFACLKQINARPIIIISNDIIAPLTSTIDSYSNDDRIAFDMVYYKKKISPSVGVQAGFDIRIYSSISLLLNAEVIATGAIPPITNIEKPDSPVLEEFTNYIRTPNGSLISFPIHIGLRFWFY